MEASQIDQMIAVMARLRKECPWDAEQTHSSLVTYLIEETYELLEAIETSDFDSVEEELGDVLLQVLFHSQIASESKSGFDIQDVAKRLREKLESRHPHVFGDVIAEKASDVAKNWEQIKATEKGRTSPTEGVPFTQPALSLAAKLVHRATRFGMEGEGTPTPMSESEFGVALFELAKSAAQLGIDPEAALRKRAREYAHELDLREVE